MDKKRLKKVLFVCIVLILVLAMLYSGLRILESTILFDIEDQMQTKSKIIIRNGVKYYPRKDITVVMLMGVNRIGKVEPTAPNKSVAVDMVSLLIFDEKTQTCNVLNLNRDMMVDIPVLNEHGKAVGIANAQLAYSHSYGTGLRDSCENVRMTVSNLLYGLQIDYYFALNMDTIGILNDSVGGVTVNIVDDFSQLDPSLTKGKVHLTGKQAVNFVQSRSGVGDELNLSRMERQSEYMSNFVPALKNQLKQESGYVVKTYDAISDYIVTDCVVDAVSRMVSDYGHYTLGEMLSVEGDNVLGEKYYEFYADEKALDDLILRLFYAPK